MSQSKMSVIFLSQLLIGFLLLLIMACDSGVTPTKSQSNQKSKSTHQPSQKDNKNPKENLKQEIPKQDKEQKKVKEQPETKQLEQKPVYQPGHIPGVPDLDITHHNSIEYNRVETSKTLNREGLSHLRKKQYEQAIPFFIKALEKNPDNLLSRYNLACTYALDGDRKNALNILIQFKNAGCTRCMKFLAKATSDKDFSALQKDAEFIEITAEALAMAEKVSKAQWFTFKAREYLEPNSIEVKNLPAISKDGKSIAVARVGTVNQGGHCSTLDLTLQIIEVRSDKVVKEQLLSYNNEDVQETTAKKAIENANWLLVDKNWTPFRLEGGGSWKNEPIEVGSLTVMWKEPRLTVMNKKGVRLLEHKYKEWSSGKWCGAWDYDEEIKEVACSRPCDKEDNAAFVTRTWLSGKHHVLLLLISYEGSDTCIEPSETYHAIQL